MTKKFLKFKTELGTLYFSNSGEYSYAVTPFGVLVTRTHEVELNALINDVKVTAVHDGVRINEFTLRLTEKTEVRLYAKRKAIEVPEAYGGFKFGSTVFRTIMVPTSEVPVYEVPFSEAQHEVSSEVLVGLA